MKTFTIGDRFAIPQWEHTRHNGFAEIIDVGRPGTANATKVRVRWPDLSEAWVSARQLEKDNYRTIKKGKGVPRSWKDFWVKGEQEYLFNANKKRLQAGKKGHTHPRPGRNYPPCDVCGKPVRGSADAAIVPGKRLVHRRCA